MKYSVAIAAHNARRTLGETLTSVLSQTIKPAEVVVVDDGSSDATAQIARTASSIVRVIEQENKGSGAAFTRAIRATRCDIVATVDSDDLWLPQKMEKQLQILKNSGPRSFVFAKHRQFQHGSTDMTSGEVRPGLLRSDLVFYRDTFDEVGDIIDPPGGRGDMVDWLARAREVGVHFHTIDEVLVMRRAIAGSLSSGRDPEKDRGYLAVAYLAMQRRKQAASEGEK
ncbi:glycosyltransferase family A protein [Pacificibacter sp.]|uniref:glycosyltransferase family 2 protein n=1 Tax=Pacificibacter sp. TaxID=1917866 RepID=UPI00321A6217